MEISIPGLKLNLVTLLIIVVLFWIIAGHLLFSTCTVSASDFHSIFKSTASRVVEAFTNRKKEGFTAMKDSQFAKANEVPVDT